jgi:hypothetical protein
MSWRLSLLSGPCTSAGCGPNPDLAIIDDHEAQADARLDLDTDLGRISPLL